MTYGQSLNLQIIKPAAEHHWPKPHRLMKAPVHELMKAPVHERHFQSSQDCRKPSRVTHILISSKNTLATPTLQ